MESLASRGSSEISKSPFLNSQYTGNISIEVIQDKKSSAYFIQVKGKRITLETFHGPYFDDLTKIFKERILKRPNEFQDMKEIFGNSLTRKNYGNQKPQTDQEIEERITFNAKRAFMGNPFTGFAVMENTNNKIIGFVSIGAGYERGESQSALIVHQDYQKKAYGREAALLAASLAYIYFLNFFAVGPQNNRASVQKFTAQVLNSNQDAMKFIKKMGLTLIRPLASAGADLNAERSLYGIDGKDVVKNLERQIDLKNITWEVLKI